MLNFLVNRVRAVVASSLLVLSLAIAQVAPVQAGTLFSTMPTIGQMVAGTAVVAVAEAPTEPLTEAEAAELAAKEEKEAAKLEAKKLKEEKKLAEKAEKTKLKEAKKAAKLEAKKLKEQQEAEEDAAKAEAKKLKEEEKMALKQAKEEAKAALLLEMEAAE